MISSFRMISQVWNDSRVQIGHLLSFSFWNDSRFGTIPEFRSSGDLLSFSFWNDSRFGTIPELR